MRAGARGIATILLWAWGAAAAADDPTSVNVEVGGVSIELPAPAGQVEITVNRERVRQFTEALMPAENRHLASFALAGDVDRVVAGESLTRWASVQAIREVESVSLSEAEFAIVREQMRTSWKDEIAKIAAESERLFAGSSERVKEKLDVDMQFAASDFVPVEVIADEADAFSTMLLVRNEVKAKGTAIDSKLITTITMMRLANRIVALYYYDQQKTDDDIAAVRQATLDWIAAVRAANTAP